MLYLQRQRASIQTVALVMLCGSVVVLLAFAWAPDRTFLCRAEGGCDVASPPSVLLSIFSFFADKRAEQKPSHTTAAAESTAAEPPAQPEDSEEE